MTHFSAYTNVTVPKDALDTISEKDIEAQIAEMFAPYDEQTQNPEYLETVKDEEFGDYQHNPNSKWDWYVIGGRFDGVFDDKKNITSYMNGNLVKAEDIYDYASTSLEQVEGIARDFLEEYKSIAHHFGPIPPIPEYKDVRDGNMTEEEFAQKQEVLRGSAFFEKTIDLIKYTSERVEKISGIDPGYLGLFSTMPISLIREITLEDDEKDFQTCVSLLDWFSPISYVDQDNWHEYGDVGWFGYIGQDEREEKKWVYEYVDLLEQATQKTTDNEQSCIVIVDVHI